MPETTTTTTTNAMISTKEAVSDTSSKQASQKQASQLQDTDNDNDNNSNGRISVSDIAAFFARYDAEHKEELDLIRERRRLLGRPHDYYNEDYELLGSDNEEEGGETGQVDGVEEEEASSIASSGKKREEPGA